MDHGLETDGGHVHPGFPQAPGIGLAFIPEHIGFPIEDHGRGQPFQLVPYSPERGCGYLVPVLLANGVLVPEPLHPGPVQVVPFREFTVAACVKAGIGHRIVQQLLLDERPFPVLCHDCHHRGHIASHAVPGHGQCARIGGKAHGPHQFRHHAHHAVALLNGHRITRFRGTAVFREDEQGTGPGSQFTHQLLMGMIAAEHPAGAVDEKNHISQRRRIARIHQVNRYRPPSSCIDTDPADLGWIFVHRTVLRLFQHHPSLGRRKFKNKGWFGIGLTDSFRFCLQWYTTFHMVTPLWAAWAVFENCFPAAPVSL